MADFCCRFSDGRESTVQADSVPAALLQAQRDGTSVLQIRERKPPRADPRVTEHEIATLYRQLAAMLRAGLPLSEGLRTIARDTTNPALREVCYTLYVTLAEGEPFASGLAKFPGLFPRLHLALARAGERAGLLPATLSQMADYVEHIGGLGRKVSSALVYPAVVGTIALALLSSYWGSGLVVQIAEVYDDLGITRLPTVTSLLLRVYQVAAPAILLTLLAAGIIWLILRTYYRSRRGRYRLDRVKLWLPFIGHIVSRGALARFCRTFGMLLNNGVEVESALELAGEASGNAMMARAARNAVGHVLDGAPIAAALAAGGVFPPAVTEQISTGERGGTLLLSLARLADFYEAQTEHLTRAATAVLEPLLILILGVAVGISVISLMLPLIHRRRACSAADACGSISRQRGSLSLDEGSSPHGSIRAWCRSRRCVRLRPGDREGVGPWSWPWKRSPWLWQDCWNRRHCGWPA
jgi:type IV pilus assembly protein PilC